MRKGAFVLDPVQTQGVNPFLVEARLTTRDFFAMFDTPFLYGGGWDEGADATSQMVVVLSKTTNEKAFGGQDSVGRTLRLDGRDFKVIGVLDEWTPTPKFYDLNNGAFDEIEEIFVPFSLGTLLEVQSSGNVNCWKMQSLSSFQDFLNSECVWIQAWVELSDGDKVEDYQTFIDNYVREQKTFGRFERPLNNRLFAAR